MKKLILSAVLFMSIISFVSAQKTTWNLDKVHSKLTFTVVHLSMSEVDGVFKDYSATITTTKEDFSDAVFEVTANLTRIQLGAIVV